MSSWIVLTSNTPHEGGLVLWECSLTRSGEYMQLTSLTRSKRPFLARLIRFLLFWRLGGFGFFGNASCFYFVIFGVTFGHRYWEACIFHQWRTYTWIFLVLCHLLVPVQLMALQTFIYHPSYAMIKISLSDNLAWNAIRKLQGTSDLIISKTYFFTGTCFPSANRWVRSPSLLLCQHKCFVTAFKKRPLCLSPSCLCSFVLFFRF